MTERVAPEFQRASERSFFRRISGLRQMQTPSQRRIELCAETGETRVWAAHKRQNQSSVRFSARANQRANELTFRCQSPAVSVRKSGNSWSDNRCWRDRGTATREPHVDMTGGEFCPGPEEPERHPASSMATDLAEKSRCSCGEKMGQVRERNESVVPGMLRAQAAPP